MARPQPFSKWPDNLPPLETAEKLRAQRDELLAALEEARMRCRCAEIGQDLCLGCEHDIGLVARIKGTG
jgi:hypothetical protein